MCEFQELSFLFGVRNFKTNSQLQKEFSQHFYYPNVCQYCSKFGPQIATNRCNNCHEVLYCLPDHSKHHWKEHRELCGVMDYLKKTENKQCLFEDGVAKDLGKQCRLIELAEEKLGRKLQPYEHDMFIFPRFCLVCYESKVEVLKECPNCPQGNFCTEHFGNIIPCHVAACSMFHNTFQLDRHWIVFKDLSWSQFVHILPHNKKTINLPDKSLTFMQMYVMPYHNRVNFRSFEVSAIVSSVYTRALTLIYALQKLRLTLCSQLVVHVINKRKSVEDANHFVEWETLHHWFPRLKFLKICFIGCQMESKVYVISLCDNCKKKTLKIEISNLSYIEYYTINKRNPDVIISYDVDILTHYTWFNAKSLLTNLNTPIVLTGKCSTDVNKAATDCVINANNFSRIELNPFHSMRVQRFMNDFAFSNEAISIYSYNLVPKICGVNNPILPCNRCKDCITQKSLHEVWTLLLQEQKERNKKLLTQLGTSMDGVVLMGDWLCRYTNKFGEINATIKEMNENIVLLESHVALVVEGLELAEQEKKCKDCV